MKFRDWRRLLITCWIVCNLGESAPNGYWQCRTRPQASNLIRGTLESDYVMEGNEEWRDSVGEANPIEHLDRLLQLLKYNSGPGGGRGGCPSHSATRPGFDLLGWW